MPRWAKLSERVGQDARLCRLAEESPVAALLFTWSLPAADVYGIIPGDPREYHARVAGALDIADEDVAAAIDAQVGAGLLTKYKAAGKVLLYVRRYHRYQDVRWARVGAPEHPLPGGWVIPDSLRALLERSETATPQDFGLCATSTGLSVEVQDQSRSRDVAAETVESVETVEKCGLGENGASTGLSVELPDQSRQDTDTDTDTDTENGDDSRARARGPDTDPSDEHLLLSDFPELMDLLTDLRGGVWSVRKRRWWVVVLARAARDAHTDLDEDEIAVALREHIPDVADRPEAWMTRLLAAKHKRVRAAAKAGRGGYAVPREWHEGEELFPPRQPKDDA